MIEPQFTTRARLEYLLKEENAVVYDTSTHAPTSADFGTVNMSELSPFVQYGNIPVPGLTGETSDTVEGIWQGLKIIKGKIDQDYFHGKGRARRGIPSGHLYNGRKLGVIEARRKIYVPAFTFMWEHRVDPTIRQLFVERARKDVPQYFLDVDTNQNIADASSPYAHSAAIVELIKKDLATFD